MGLGFIRGDSSVWGWCGCGRQWPGDQNVCLQKTSAWGPSADYGTVARGAQTERPVGGLSKATIKITFGPPRAGK